MNKTLTIGIDLGGTRIKAVVVDDEGNLLHHIFTSTKDKEGELWKHTVRSLANELKEKFSIKHAVIGVSAPGLPNTDNTAIACMPGRLQGLENFDWNDFLKSPSFVLNDAVAALLAEATTGAAIQSRNAILVTLGTGVGGALLINGNIFQGSFHKAGHIGHTVVDSTGDCDVTGMPGSLEDCIGNCSVKKRSGGVFSSTDELLKAYKTGNALAEQVWLTSVKKLAIALASASNFISPDTIVVGGGIAEANNDLFEPLNKWFDEFEWQPGGFRPQIVKAIHGELAGARGAAIFARKKNKQDEFN